MNANEAEAAFEAVRNTLAWAGLSMLIVMIPGCLLAYHLARSDFFGKRVISALVSLPLVMPPTAAGYLLLRLFADNGPLGRKTLGVDLGILLDWKGVVLACSLMSMPLVVRTARLSFEGVNPRFEAMSRTLGRGRMRTFCTVTLPLAGRGLLAALILGFTRAVGEFGASVVLAGNIPGRTQTLASAIYSAQQAGRQFQADILLCVALFLGFVAIYASERLSLALGNGGRRG